MAALDLIKRFLGRHYECITQFTRGWRITSILPLTSRFKLCHRDSHCSGLISQPYNPWSREGKKTQPSPLFSVKKPFKQTPQLSSHPRRLGNDLLMGISKTNRWFCSQATWSLLTTLPLVVSFSSFSLFLFLFQSFPTGSGVIILSSRTFCR